MEGLNTTFGVLAIVASLLIVGYLVFARRKVGELQYRWETGRWPHSGSRALDGLNQWEAQQDVSDADVQIANIEAQIVQVSAEYRRKRAELGALSMIQGLLVQLEKQQEAWVKTRERKAWLASIVKSSATPAPALGPPTQEVPSNGKVLARELATTSSKS